MRGEAPADAAGRLPGVAWPTLDLLQCPECGGVLEGGENGLACTKCGGEWPERDGWLDFRPAEFSRDSGTWASRQQRMEDWYDNLLSQPDQAEACFSHDFDPLASRLAALNGLVVDIGAGGGVARTYLSPEAHYVGIDPSPRWFSPAWSRQSKRHAEPAAAMTFVLGIGERLPLRSGRADAALALFSINHAADPRRVVGEALRVLRPGGRLLMTVEDVEPRWRDLADPGYRAGYTPFGQALRQKLASTLLRRHWPVGADHVAVREGELRRWLNGADGPPQRTWSAGYLLLDAVKADE